MKNVMGIIYTGENDQTLQELTRVRPVASIPFGGRYRLIDFPLSNLVRSGVRNVGVILQRDFASLLDHLDSGMAWDLSRMTDGLFYLPPYDEEETLGRYRGEVEALKHVMRYIRRSKQQEVIFTGSQVVASMRLEPVVERHRASGADVTLVCHRRPVVNDGTAPRTYLRMEETGRIVDLEVRSLRPKGEYAYMDMLVISKGLLTELVEECVARGGYDLLRDAFAANLDRIELYGWEYDGHVARIDSLQSYYDESMALLDPKRLRALFFGAGRVYTKIKNEPPAKHTAGAEVKNSLLADGCVIEGRVEDSILFRDVRVRKGAFVRNCIVMQSAEIHEDAILDHVIMDKSASLGAGAHLLGQPTHPLVVGKGVAV